MPPCADKDESITIARRKVFSEREALSLVSFGDILTVPPFWTAWELMKIFSHQASVEEEAGKGTSSKPGKSTDRASPVSAFSTAYRVRRWISLQKSACNASSLLV